MFTTFGQKIGQTVCNLLPFETALLFILLSVLVWPIPLIGPISPSLGLVAIFYWSIYRPDLLRPSIVFILGLLNDALNDLPMGLSACLYLGVHQLAYSQRRYFVGQIFYMLWFAFALMATLVVFLTWGVASVYNGAASAFLPVCLQLVLTIVLFPIPAWALNRLQHTFLSQA